MMNSTTRSTGFLMVAAVLALVAGEVCAKPKAAAPPPEGSFQVTEGMNRDYCLIDMRDAAGKMWPMFWLAHPKGTGSVDTGAGQGTFTIFGSGSDVQFVNGKRQDRRIGGVLVKEETFKDGKGVVQKRRAGPDIQLGVRVTGPGAADVTIAYNGRTVSVPGKLTIKPAAPTGKGSIDLNGSCQTTMRELGLGNDEAIVKIAFFAPGR